MKKQRAKDRHLYSYMDTVVDDIAAAAAGSTDTPVVCTMHDDDDDDDDDDAYTQTHTELKTVICTHTWTLWLMTLLLLLDPLTHRWYVQYMTMTMTMMMTMPTHRHTQS